IARQAPPPFPTRRSSDLQTAELLERMNTDALTFGGRIEPATSDDYPAAVAEAIGDRQVYDYTVEMRWDDTELGSTDEAVEVNGRSEEHTSELQSRFDLVC